MIDPSDIGGDADLARTVLVHARIIAPCLDSLVDGDGDDPKPRSDAIAILKGVVAGIRPRGVKSERSGSSAAEYIVSASSFTAEDRAGLRYLCGLSATSGALPRGSFPPPSRVVSHLFPEC